MHLIKLRNYHKNSYVFELLTPYQPTCSLRSSNQQLLSVPVIKSSSGKRSFTVAAPTVWNSLPLHLRLSVAYLYTRFALNLRRISILLRSSFIISCFLDNDPEPCLTFPLTKLLITSDLGGSDVLTSSVEGAPETIFFNSETSVTLDLI